MSARERITQDFWNGWATAHGNRPPHPDLSKVLEQVILVLDFICEEGGVDWPTVQILFQHSQWARRSVPVAAVSWKLMHPKYEHHSNHLRLIVGPYGGLETRIVPRLGGLNCRTGNAFYADYPYRLRRELQKDRMYAEPARDEAMDAVRTLLGNPSPTQIEELRKRFLKDAAWESTK